MEAVNFPLSFWRWGNKHSLCWIRKSMRQNSADWAISHRLSYLLHLFICTLLPCWQGGVYAADDRYWSLGCCSWSRLSSTSDKEDSAVSVNTVRRAQQTERNSVFPLHEATSLSFSTKVLLYHGRRLTDKRRLFISRNGFRINHGLTHATGFFVHYSVISRTISTKMTDAMRERNKLRSFALCVPVTGEAQTAWTQWSIQFSVGHINGLLV